MKRLEEQTRVTQVSHTIVERPKLVSTQLTGPASQDEEYSNWKRIDEAMKEGLELYPYGCPKPVFPEHGSPWPTFEVPPVSDLMETHCLDVEEELSSVLVKILRERGIKVNCDCSPELAEVQGKHIHLQGEEAPSVHGPFYPIITGMMRPNYLLNVVEIYDGEKWVLTELKLDDPGVWLQQQVERNVDSI